jgi:hypothetical protein
MELDFGTAPSDSPEAVAEAEPPNEQKTSEPATYSPIFKLGLFLSVPLCFSSMLLLYYWSDTTFCLHHSK